MDLVGWYFPYLNITFDHVLLTGACIWDRWMRLVPFGLRPRDGRTAKRLQEELEFFETVAVGEDTADVDAAFVDWLEGGFVRREPAYAEVLGKIAIERTAARPHRIFKADDHPGLVAKLEELGLSKDFAANWKGTSRLLQDLYLCCLVQHVRASRPELQEHCLLADDLLFNRAALHARGGFGHEIGWRLTLELPLPVPQEWRIVERADFDALRAYRDASSELRKNYLEAVTRCAAGVSLTTNAKDVAGVARAHAAAVTDICKELIQMGGRHGVPLERGYLLASWLPQGLQSCKAAVDPTCSGPIAYQIDRIPLAKGSVEKLAGDTPGTLILSPEEPLATRSGLQRLGSAFSRLVGGV